MSIPLSSGREIVYQGRRRDLIEPTVCSIKIDHDLIFEELLTRHAKGVHPGPISWLQAELQNPIASAAQGQARLHPRSIATAFDAWSYLVGRRLGDIEAEQEDAAAKKISLEVVKHSLESNGSLQGMNQCRLQSFWFRTKPGTIKIRLPRRPNCNTNA